VQLKTCSSMMWYTQTWNDYRVQWNISEFGRLPNIQLSSKKIWTPKLLLRNK